MSRQRTPPGSPQARFVASCPSPAKAMSIPPARGEQTKTGQTKTGQTKTPEVFPPAFLLAVAHGLLIVVEPALARLVIALPSRPVGRTALVTPHRSGDFA